MDGQAKGHAALADRVGFIEASFGDSFDKHAKALQDLRDSHEAHANAVKHHASHEERIHYLEKAMGDSAVQQDQHTNEHADPKESNTVDQMEAHASLPPVKPSAVAGAPIDAAAS